MPIVKANVTNEAILMTDESAVYRHADTHFGAHGTTYHGQGQYVDCEIPVVHSNSVDGYFSFLKRGRKGIYQHCGQQHLRRYLAEYEFRCKNWEALGCNDVCRSVNALGGIIGKRLTCRIANLG
jgi:ISXO2-like transposase domain